MLASVMKHVKTILHVTYYQLGFVAGWPFKIALMLCVHLLSYLVLVLIDTCNAIL
jgi:hypothetical protein